MVAKDSGDGWTVRVSNRKGHLLRIEATFQCDLDAMSLLTLSMHPGVRTVVKSREVHKGCVVLVAEPLYKEVMLTQHTESDGVLRKKHEQALLHMTEDRRNPNAMTVTFKALESTSFKKYTGTTVYHPVTDPATGCVVGSRVESTQDVLPKGLPQWLTRMPLLGNMLREAGLKHVRTLLLELKAAVDKVVAHAAATGVSHAEAVEAVCDPTGEWAAKQAEELRQAAAQRQQGLRSFAFDDAWEEEEEEEEEDAMLEEGDEEGDGREGEEEGEEGEGGEDGQAGEGQDGSMGGAGSMGARGSREGEMCGGGCSRKAVAWRGEERRAYTGSDDVESGASDQS
ncbi:hypothetical protein HYH03_005035 [Edaphochlamys debaryana]|uniref:Uncharacterized protein n=1 Tax=Edaphochlamys debaryana TaxID=47281 RepID=A0A835Y8M7_9CHLO|nr:hypothetical protein HYH03_005035 [Edaphochlamys debaryana]|eukprot:KAG2497032.1 hypothetical protein HYH03_005035 [Edaphochlamys debaryana]